MQRAYGDKDNVFIVAARNGRLEALRQLVKLTDVELVWERNARGLTALHEAVANKHNDCARLLLGIIKEESEFSSRCLALPSRPMGP